MEIKFELPEINGKDIEEKFHKFVDSFNEIFSSFTVIDADAKLFCLSYDCGTTELDELAWGNLWRAHSTTESKPIVFFVFKKDGQAKYYQLSPAQECDEERYKDEDSRKERYTGDWEIVLKMVIHFIRKELEKIKDFKLQVDKMEDNFTDLRALG